MTRKARPGWPMLPRVLAVMLAAVLAVQFVNFAVLQYVPHPPPPIFTVAEVASVLRRGQETGEFRVHLSPTPPPASGRNRVKVLTAALARETGVRQDEVGLAFLDPPEFGEGPRWSPLSNPGDARDTILVGGFTASLRRADGRWLTVEPVLNGRAAWRIRLLLWLLVAVATVVPFAWWLARRVTRPIAVFADAAERIGRNPYTPPLTAEGPAEIVHATRAMNEMQQRLTRFVDDRTLTIGAIAHDLRTPLMRLKLRLENVPSELRRGAERDVADMEAMIGAATAHVRGATQVGARRRIDLRSLAESAVNDLVDRGERAALLPGGHVVVDGEPTALRSLLDNLLANAIRYAGDAEVSVDRDGRSAVIEVRDHGTGLAEEYLERVFEPFFRVEPSRHRDTGGTGLGLASVRGIAHRHGGEAAIRNHPDGGLVARVTLPL